MMRVVFPALIAALSGAAEPLEAAAEPLEIAFVGDVILHRSLQRQVKAEGYGPLWDGVRATLTAPALTVANLEGPIAPGVNRAGKISRGAEGGGFPRFNFPASLAPALADLGVDVVQTANNHSLDRGSRGARITLELVEAAGLTAVGTRRRAGQAYRHVVEVNGKKIGFVACTFWTNGQPDPKYLVRRCQSRKALFADVRALRAEADVVVALVHWGIEDAESPGGSQVRFARKLVDAGVDVVAGGHPHVLQRVDTMRAEDGRRAVVAYSLGNFVSAQRSVPHRTGMILRVRVDDSGVVSHTLQATFARRQGGRLRVVPLDEAEDSPGARAAQAVLKRVVGAARVAKEDG